ncbi:hypothetical protein SAMN06295974_3818 [Plantibacter flavus]|uniref:DUF4190 domain-containing protein n=1 Tax=Plantibacter flavus TaxID=150123 RepID=A0A3N2BL94_9MICO|nr:DUF4190 domain-containing protein [Plantibacter flavus]ROR76035.1 hypothetical protein EDD42_3988 [Plantibacter flavus]SMG49092.1 hypothetical protein SAMN06295974_3818 [Plantibacter flavus]
MGLFIDAGERVPRRAPMSGLAITALVFAATGFITVIGFFIAPALAHVALLRLRNRDLGGRRLAIAALWISYISLTTGTLSLVIMLIAAYAALPAPQFF